MFFPMQEIWGCQRGRCVAFRQPCHDNFFLSPVADHGFVICTSNDFELVLKSETLTSALNTGHFDLKLFVATLSYSVNYLFAGNASNVIIFKSCGIVL